MNCKGVRSLSDNNLHPIPPSVSVFNPDAVMMDGVALHPDTHGVTDIERIRMQDFLPEGVVYFDYSVDVMGFTLCCAPYAHAYE